MKGKLWKDMKCTCEMECKKKIWNGAWKDMKWRVNWIVKALWNEMKWIVNWVWKDTKWSVNLFINREICFISFYTYIHWEVPIMVEFIYYHNRNSYYESYLFICFVQNPLKNVQNPLTPRGNFLWKDMKFDEWAVKSHIFISFHKKLPRGERGFWTFFVKRYEKIWNDVWKDMKTYDS